MKSGWLRRIMGLRPSQNVLMSPESWAQPRRKPRMSRRNARKLPSNIPGLGPGGSFWIIEKTSHEPGVGTAIFAASLDSARDGADGAGIGARRDRFVSIFGPGLRKGP